MRQLVLASGSPYRRALLERLAVPFVTGSPDLDESAPPGEPPAVTAQRLCEAKARALESRYAGALIIGSDQVAELDGVPLGKPLTHENAVRQLTRCSGRTVAFHTGVCLLDTTIGTCEVRVVRNEVLFRTLAAVEIDRYLRREQPYDCTGSAKVDGLGIALIERLAGDDPNALIGLPLITLIGMLRRAGVQLP